MDPVKVSFIPNGAARSEGARLAMRYLQARAGGRKDRIYFVVLLLGALLLGFFGRDVARYLAAVHPLAVWLPLTALAAAWLAFFVYCRGRLADIYQRLASKGILSPVTVHFSDRDIRVEANGSVANVPFSSIDAAFETTNAMNFLVQDGLINISRSAFDGSSASSTQVMEFVLAGMRPEARELSRTLFSKQS